MLLTQLPKSAFGCTTSVKGFGSQYAIKPTILYFRDIAYIQLVGNLVSKYLCVSVKKVFK